MSASKFQPNEEPLLLANLPNERGRFHGVLQIARFNWPWYSGVLVVLLLAAGLLPRIELLPGARWVVIVMMSPAIFWAAASLLVSHWVYDCSRLYRWDWGATRLGISPARAANIHAGFDETSQRLRRIFPGLDLVVWDIYRPATMTEASILRARLGQEHAEATPVDFRKLPERDGALDAAFLIFAAHEIRAAREREEFFGELHRILKPGAAVLLVEHLRDWKNFLAYGPGFLHFLSRTEWLRLADRGGFQAIKEFSITPFVRIFLFRKPPVL